MVRAHRFFIYMISRQAELFGRVGLSIIGGTICDTRISEKIRLPDGAIAGKN